jgi:hypothetical protein
MCAMSRGRIVAFRMALDPPMRISLARAKSQGCYLIWIPTLNTTCIHAYLIHHHSYLSMASSPESFTRFAAHGAAAPSAPRNPMPGSLLSSRSLGSDQRFGRAPERCEVRAARCKS